MIWFWIGVAVVAFIIEVLTTSLVSIWFAGGAVVAILVALLGLPAYSQITSFFAASILFFAWAKTWMESHLPAKGGKIATNLDRLIGEHGSVTQIIRPNEGGRVTVSGMDWKAIGAHNETIGLNEPIKVVGITGVKLEVIPVKNEEEIKKLSLSLEKESKEN